MFSRRHSCRIGAIVSSRSWASSDRFGPDDVFLLMRAERRWSYLGGAALALLPLGWLTVAAGPKEILNNLLLFPVIYSSPARHLPIFSAENYLVLLFFAHIIAVAGNIF